MNKTTGAMQSESNKDGEEGGKSLLQEIATNISDTNTLIRKSLVSVAPIGEEGIFNVHYNSSAKNTDDAISRSRNTEISETRQITVPIAFVSSNIDLSAKTLNDAGNINLSSASKSTTALIAKSVPINANSTIDKNAPSLLATKQWNKEETQPPAAASSVVATSLSTHGNNTVDYSMPSQLSTETSKKETGKIAVPAPSNIANNSPITPTPISSQNSNAIDNKMPSLLPIKSLNNEIVYPSPSNKNTQQQQQSELQFITPDREQQDPIWKYYQRSIKRDPKKRRYVVKCNLCSFTMDGRVHKMKMHFVKECPNLTDEVRLDVRNIIALAPLDKRKPKKIVSNDGNVPVAKKLKKDEQVTMPPCPTVPIKNVMNPEQYVNKVMQWEEEYLKANSNNWNTLIQTIHEIRKFVTNKLERTPTLNANNNLHDVCDYICYYLGTSLKLPTSNYQRLPLSSSIVVDLPYEYPGNTSKESLPVIALRGNLNASIQSPMKSQHKYHYHCHVVTLLGVATILCNVSNKPKLPIRLIFQTTLSSPSHDNADNVGASYVIKYGALKDVKFILGMQVDKRFGNSTIVCKKGCMNPSNDIFTITLTYNDICSTKSGQNVNLIVIASSFIMNIQNILSCNRQFAQSSIIQFTSIQSSNGTNETSAPSDRVIIKGKIQTNDNMIRSSILSTFKKVLQSIVDMHATTIEHTIDFSCAIPPLLNSASFIPMVHRSIYNNRLMFPDLQINDDKDILIEDSDDFSQYLESTEGCMVRFGLLENETNDSRTTATNNSNDTPSKKFSLLNGCRIMTQLLYDAASYVHENDHHKVGNISMKKH